MRFALLGYDEWTPALVEAAHRAGHEITCVWDAEPLRARLNQLYPRAAWPSDWVSFLDFPTVDAVLVARGMDDEARADSLRRVAQTAGAALVSHPLHASVLIYFELEMICAETKARLMPFCPWRWRAGVAQIAEWISDANSSPIGRCEQLLMERTSPLRDTRRVTDAFVRDVDLALHVVGDLNSLSAMAPGWEQGQLGNLGVQMTGPAGISVRWSIGPVEATAGLRITLVGPNGKAALTLPDDGATGELTTNGSGGTERVALETVDAVAQALAAFVDAASDAPDWHVAARGMELADSIEISLRKGKTIPLYNTSPSEQGTFKGVMAAAGCLLLFVALGSVLLGLLLARFGVPHAEKLPIAVAGLLIVFLLMQSLRFAFPRSS